MLQFKLASIFLLFCRAAAESGIFYNPPTGGRIHDYSENPVYELQQTVQLRWATSLEWLSIMLWQNDNSNYEWIQTNVTGVTTYNWIVSTNRNLDDGVVFFFQIRDATDIENFDRIFASHYFNITKPDAAITTTSTTTTPTVATAPTKSSKSSITYLTIPTALLTASVTPGTSGSSPTDSGLPTASAISSSGMTSDVKLGVGVGVGLGSALLIALGFISYLLRRRRKASKPPASDPMYYPSEPPGYTKQQRYQQAPFEAPAEQIRYELPP